MQNSNFCQFFVGSSVVTITTADTLKPQLQVSGKFNCEWFEAYEKSLRVNVCLGGYFHSKNSCEFFWVVTIAMADTLKPLP